MIVGGSLGLTGSVCLAGLAALRSGAGLVTAGVPEDLSHIFEVKLTEVMTLPLPADKGRLKDEAYADIKMFVPQKVDVLALGMGLGRWQQSKVLARRIIAGLNLPVVLDADGINAFSGKLAYLKKHKQLLITTPHLGEFSRLIGRPVDFIKQNRKKLAQDFALRYNLTLVLKGRRTIVTNGRDFFENPIGNPGMATAGSGDVLSGVISALLAQGLPGFKAAKTAVFIHSLAGDLAAKDKGEISLIASDIIEYLPLAFKEMKSGRMPA